MEKTVTLNEEELVALEELLDVDWREGRTELRRTHNLSFHDSVAHHLEVIDNLRQKIETELEQKQPAEQPVTVVDLPDEC